MESDSGGRLDRHAWIDAAYAVFVEVGVGAVRVDPLANVLGVTRGSFYWHFKNRRDLLLAVIERWDAEQTKGVINEVEREGGPADERLLRLLCICGSDDGRLEIDVRAWAGGDPDGLKVIAQIDEDRVGYLCRLAREAGVPEDDVGPRARIAYRAWLGLYLDATPADLPQRLSDMERLWRMVLGR